MNKSIRNMNWTVGNAELDGKAQIEPETMRDEYRRLMRSEIGWAKYYWNRHEQSRCLYSLEMAYKFWFLCEQKVEQS